MKRFALLIFAAGLVLAGPAGAAEPTPQALLTDAILCKGDPLATVRRMAASGVDADGHPDKVCPMTIALTPLEDGTFLLGCGWCNG